jgi:regulator of sigma E protease
MILIFLVSFGSLIGLLIIHELSHFLAAKIFKVPVEEFGLGYPPRLLGKKIGSTLYSLNLLPLGAFVRIGEKELKSKNFWQRFIVISAGVVSFWLMGFFLIVLLMNLGFPHQVSDDEPAEAYLQILNVNPNSPAEAQGILAGDLVKEIIVFGNSLAVNKIEDFQKIIKENAGKEIKIVVQRGKEEKTIEVVPRIDPPLGEGPLGVSLARIAFKKHSPFSAFKEGLKTSFKITKMILIGYKNLIVDSLRGEKLQGELIGPVGILNIFIKAGNLGISYFLQTISLVAFHVTVFNALPIPAFDGGQLLFLLIEKIKGRPIPHKIEQKINAISFLLLIFLGLVITLKDIRSFFKL